jgi:pentatricopeptide repeat protein
LAQAKVFLNRLIDSSINPELPWAALMAPLALRQHTKVISQLGSLGTWTKVLQLLGKMRSMRVQPNVITYNSSFSDSQIFSDLSISLLSLALSLAVVCCCSLFVVRLWV